MLEIYRTAAWLAALACEAAMLGCGGRVTTPDVTGGSGGGSSSSTGATGSTVGVGAGGMGSGTTTGTTTTGSSSTGSTTAATTTTVATTTGSITTGATTTGGMGGTGGCTGGVCCDRGAWPGFAPLLITTPNCSDFDSDNNAVGIRCIMPGGVWSVDVDGAGTSSADSEKIEPCGTTGNGFHFVGRGHSTWGADVAAAIVSQTQPVDVSAYRGMSFVMRSATANSLIFKVQNSYSQPPCGKCDDFVIGNECYSGYIKNIALLANDTRPIVVWWADLSQQSWGYRAPGSVLFDVKDLISVAFAFDKSVDFDVCLDDIKFVP